MPKDKHTTTEFGQAISEARKHNGLTQTQVASALGHVWGMTQGRISRLERGAWIPNAGQFENLLRAMRCTEDQARQLRYIASTVVERPDHAAE